MVLHGMMGIRGGYGAGEEADKDSARNRIRATRGKGLVSDGAGG